MHLDVPLYNGVHPCKRPRSETPLNLWLKARGISRFAFSREVGCDPKIVHQWANGQSIPSLIYAFKVDRATQGGVPPSSWLGTEIARLQWNASGRDWAKWDEQRKLISIKRQKGSKRG